MRVLIVKLSSMGDIVHGLPAVTDAARAIPGIEFDWVADEAFANVPGWHPNVKHVYASAHRRWKKNLWQTLRNGELRQFYRDIRQHKYDLVIDAQSNCKSAIVTRLTRGMRCGMDGDSARERIAHYAYQQKYSVKVYQHAVDRLRQLFAQALEYPMPQGPADYGVGTDQFCVPTNIELPDKFIMAIHGTSWDSKCWPEDNWRQVLTLAAQAGLSVVIPWGSEKEQQRSLRLAQGHAHVYVLPRLSLTEMAGVIACSSANICMDTGLAHMSAMLNIPAVALYGPTDNQLIGTFGKQQHHLVAKFACAPCYKTQCTYQGDISERPACFSQLPAGYVWNYFIKQVFPRNTTATQTISPIVQTAAAE